MSKVGDVDKMYGKDFSFVTTNASASDILSDEESTFIPSSLIISSPTDENGNDLGYPTLIATDADGSPIRLTYTIKPGNGIVLAYTYGAGQSDFSEVLSFAIDSDTLKTSEEDGGGYLYVSAKGLTEYSQYLTVSRENNVDVKLNELPDANRVVVAKVPLSDSPTALKIDRLTVDASKIVDGVTIKSNQTTDEASATYFANQKISVDVKNIVDNKSITVIKNGENREVLTINSNFLTPATATTYGVVKIDNSTIKMNNNGAIYINASQLPRISSKNGGRGIVGIQGKGIADLYVDDSGILRTDVSKMQKCNNIDKSKPSGGFGVCAADGRTIIATHEGVLRVVSGALDVATNKATGVVRPDNQTITIEKSGIISVNTKNLDKGTASVEGIVKYDNSTISKNAQNQLCVTNASKWDSAISDLYTRMSSLAEQLAAIKTELTNTLSILGQKIDVPFNLYTTAGKQLQSLYITVPNLTQFKTGNRAWDIAQCNGKFKISYGAGYVFSCRLNGTSLAWMQSCKIIVNGTSYGMNQDIKLSTNDAVCSLEFTIAGFGNSKVPRPQGSWSLEFKDSAGNPLKAINIFIFSDVTANTFDRFICGVNSGGYTFESGLSGVYEDDATVDSLITRSPGYYPSSGLSDNLVVGGQTFVGTRNTL